MKILITGGCGFVGSNLALSFKQKYADVQIICMDNLKRRGSELNIPRLKSAGIEFLHGDIRQASDFQGIGVIDVVIDAAAEPSVLAGLDGVADYLIQTNINGTFNTLEFARKNNAIFLFLSTSRIYPIQKLENIKYSLGETRFVINDEQDSPGLSSYGISENFPLTGYRSLYGATKLSSEHLVEEYNALMNIKTVVNRCGVLTGPYQMGKVDQGVVVLWMARHFWKKSLTYVGYGGDGKQVRDLLHVDDLFNLLDYQIQNIDTVNGATFNVGGGNDVSVSLLELTQICERISGNKITIDSDPITRKADIPIYISDTRLVESLCGWKPTKNVETILTEIFEWISKNEKTLKPILE